MRLAVLVALLMSGGGAGAQIAAGPVYRAVTFTLEPRDTSVPAWEIRVNADRTGTYRVMGADGAGQPVHVSEATMQRLSKGERAASGKGCETKQKNVARTGKKSIAYGGEPGCTFDATDDDGLRDAVTAFTAMAETIRFGERLAHDRRFDKLALDEDMEFLVDMVAKGDAIEVGDIAPVLQGIVGDDAVIERVRRKAARLLEGGS